MTTQHLQGSWEGVQEGHEAAGKYTLTITGNSIRYQGPKPDEWYEATFTLPPGGYPQQLRATLTGAERTKDIGAVVVAIFKIEGGTLTLAGFDPDSLDWRDPFEESPGFRYDLRKVELPENPKPPKPK